jgi:phosphate-selective porin OprO/OprP
MLQSSTDNPLPPFIGDPVIRASQSQLFNLQSALVLGPLSVQAEWTGVRVDQIGGGPVFLQAAYVMAGCFLTGEHRTYDRTYGTFGGPKVTAPFACADGPAALGAGPGAWELVARLGWLDFGDPDLPPTPSGLRAGGRLKTMTLGVNWYLSDRARLMLNYVHTVPTNLNFGRSTADSVTVRTAVFW